MVTEELHDDGLQLLRERADVELIEANGDFDSVKHELHDAHALLVRTMQIDADILSNAKKLEAVSRHGVGCDNIAVAELSRRKIPMLIAVDSNTTSVVEQVLMMMLALNKRAFQYDALTRAHQFHQRCVHPTSELLDKKALVVGFGRIGKRVAPVLKAFGMRVTVADIDLDAEFAAQLGCESCTDFRDQLADSDYVTLHVPLHDGSANGFGPETSTHNLIDKPELDALPKHAYVINCARGGIVNEAAIAESITNGSIAGFGCDVFSTEPPADDNPLLTLPNTILSPHNAASTNEGLSRMAQYSAQNILDVFDGCVRPEVVFNAAEMSRQ